jgi:2-polyprenyl-3-methyl-5-hydroxy-6-metoxy-1,4-benzoquinol methylase
MEKSNLKWKIAQKLEYKWWQKYLRTKNVEEYLTSKSAYWDAILKSIAPFLTVQGQQQILDAGCGPAGIFMVLKGNHVTAVDPLLHKYAELPHFNASDYPWVNFLHQPLETFQQKETFDIIFCINAINHVNDIELCYDRLVAALKPGGVMVISVDCHRSNVLKKIFQLLPGDMLHPVQLNLVEYNQKLIKRGMHVLNDILYKREPIFDYFITIAVKNHQ